MFLHLPRSPPFLLPSSRSQAHSLSRVPVEKPLIPLFIFLPLFLLLLSLSLRLFPSTSWVVHWKCYDPEMAFYFLVVHLRSEGAMEGFPCESHLGWAQRGLGLGPGPLRSFHTHIWCRKNVSRWVEMKGFSSKGWSSFILEAGVSNNIANEHLASLLYLKHSSVGRVKKKKVSQTYWDAYLFWVLLLLLVVVLRANQNIFYIGIVWLEALMFFLKQIWLFALTKWCWYPRKVCFFSVVWGQCLLQRNPTHRTYSKVHAWC